MNNFEQRVHLAAVALISFILAFVIARTFTTFYPSQILITGGLHIHHFWFGIVLIAIGGWLGIIYNNKEINIAASILYGVGGGLIVDEVGLLLTFGNYRSELTWAILIVLLSFFSVLLLIYRNRQKIIEELDEFVRSKLCLVSAIFLAAISTAFIAETNNLLVIAVSASLTIVAVLIAVVFLVIRFKKAVKTEDLQL